MKVFVVVALLIESSFGFLCPSQRVFTQASAVHSPSSLFSTTTTTSNKNADIKDFDLVVVGAGIVGVQAALIASQAPYHKRVLVVDAPLASGALFVGNEDLSLGAPTGLFSKALRDTSKRINVEALRGMGLREESVWNEIIGSCVDLAQSNAQDIERQLDFAGVTRMEGLATFSNRGETTSMIVTKNDVSETIHTEKILLCTGSQPFRPEGIPFDGKRIFDSDSINGISFLPRSIVITGSGIIAVEFAKIFRYAVMKA
jgi:NAD(P) transhydrogenase